MFYRRMADLNIQFNVIYKISERVTKPFYAEFDSPDIIINSSQEIIEHEKAISEEKMPGTSVYENPAVFRLLAEQLPKFDAVVLHSCSFKVKNKGIAFGAVSGTGKTTHMMLWQNMLGNEFEIINGDKPIIRFIDNKLFAYGTPWAGKENLYQNIRVPLTDVCKIERSIINKTEPMSKDEGISLLMQQIYIPFDPEMRLKTIELIYRIADSVKFWKIKCNMEPDAAKVSYKAIFSE